MKTRNSLVLIFFMFGCWLKHIDWSVAFVAYNIWYVILIAWSILSFVALWDGFSQKKGKQMAKQLTIPEMEIWTMVTVMSLVSFLLCREYLATLLFLMGHTAFFLFVGYYFEKLHRKK